MYKLHGSNILCPVKDRVPNRQLFFVDKIENIEKLTEIILEEDYYVFITICHNIGHVFHDHFCYFYSIWRQNKKKVLIKLHDRFIYDFVRATLGDEWVEEIDDNILYKIPKIYVVAEFDRNLKNIVNYLEIIEEIKYNCFRYYNIIEDRKDIVIYGRENLIRKRLLNINYKKLENNNIRSINDLSRYNFGELMLILSKINKFVFVYGAGIFYLVFLSKYVKVLEIHINIQDSWSVYYGLNNNCIHNIYVSKNSQENDTSKGIIKGQQNSRVDCDIIYDTNLEHKILKICL
jgi:hypothetical protein